MQFVQPGHVKLYLLIFFYLLSIYHLLFLVFSFVLPLISLCLSSSIPVTSSTGISQQAVSLLTSCSTWPYSPVRNRTTEQQRALHHVKGPIRKWDSWNRKFRGGLCSGLRAILGEGQRCTAWRCCLCCRTAIRQRLKEGAWTPPL